MVLVTRGGRNGIGNEVRSQWCWYKGEVAMVLVMRGGRNGVGNEGRSQWCW